MVKRIFLLVLTLLAVVGVSAQELTVLVAPFEVRAGFSRDEADTITELFLLELAKVKTLKVVDQRQAVFNEMANRMKIEMSEWFDPDKMKQFGDALNADAVVLGQMMMLGDQQIITARVLDVRTTQILAPGRMDIKNINEVISRLPAFTREIVNNLPKPPPTPFVNPFPGRWRSTITSNGQTLTCILNFGSNGQITVEQYDTNRVTRGSGGRSFTNDIKRGRGSGTYSYRESGGTVIVDISLTISGVSQEFVAVTARGSFYKSSPNQFKTGENNRAEAMQCEYYVTDRYMRDWYISFNKM